MDLLRTVKAVGVLAMALPLTGCQMGYLLHSAKGQLSLINQRMPAEKALSHPDLPAEEKRKIRLAMEAKSFAQSNLGLRKTKNYDSYVRLDRPYVTYVVSAAPRWELKAYLWWFPFVGSVPYKGFFTEKAAEEEEASLKASGLDTYRRGVSAYSTLGWFRDSILSSMTAQPDHHLVNTIIHETVHATLYIRGSSDFNERIATFIGDRGTEAFYRAKEGQDSPTLTLIARESSDAALFSDFISKEIRDLESWYQEISSRPDRPEDLRIARLGEIQKKFRQEIEPRLQSQTYKNFANVQLNNARLMVFKTYVGDLKDFEKVFDALDRDFARFLRLAKTLEKEQKPEDKLKEWTKLPPSEIRSLIQ